MRRLSRERLLRSWGMLWRSSVLLCLLLSSARAQQASPDTAARVQQISRGDVETAGDFRVGDRIILSVRGDSALSDTFTVYPGRMLKLPTLPEVSLQGVLRAELQDYLTRHIARFVKDPVVEARSLIRLGVLGEADRPGYYFVPTDGLVTDAIMLAGGPSREADATKTTVRRGTTVLWRREQLREAIVEGTTIDQLGLRSGDEIVIGRRRGGWEGFLRTTGYLSGIALSIYGATRIGR